MLSKREKAMLIRAADRLARGESTLSCVAIWHSARPGRRILEKVPKEALDLANKYLDFYGRLNFAELTQHSDSDRQIRIMCLLNFAEVG